MILAFTIVKRPSDLNLLSIKPRAMQIIADSVTFKPMFVAKNAEPNHLYGPMITLRWSQDESLCPVALVREDAATTRDREQRSVKISVKRKMGLVTAISNATIVSWLNEMLTLATIRASGGLTRKATKSYAAMQDTQSKQSWKQVTGLTVPLGMGTTSDTFPERYWLESLSTHQETSKN